MDLAFYFAPFYSSICVCIESPYPKKPQQPNRLTPNNSIQDSDPESPTTIIEKKNEDKIKAMALGKNSFN
mgnify:CR=1 FL=1